MAVNACVITVEGVLQTPISASPIIGGINLYKGLASTFHVLLVSDQDKETLDHWLKLEGLNQHGVVLYKETLGFTAAEKRLVQVNSLRARGYNIEFVVEPDPDVAAVLIISGLTVLNYLHSQYALPQWRPDFEGRTKPWEQLYEQATTAAMLRANDERLKQKDQFIAEEMWDE